MLPLFELRNTLIGIDRTISQQLQAINQLVHDYRESYGNYSGASLIQKAEILSHAKNSQFKLAQEDLHTVQQDQRFIRIQNWQTKQQAKLLAPTFWAQIKEPHLHPLKNFIDNYSCYTTEALKMMALDFLPRIEKNIKETVVSMQANKVNLYRRTMDYLTAYLAQIAQEKKRLATTLFHRLVFAAHNQDLTCDDILYGVTATLMKHDIKGLTLPQSRRQGLTEQDFKTLYHYIVQYGTKTQQQQLEKLSWSTSKGDYCYVVRGNACLLIPTSIVNSIPRSRSFAFQMGKKSRYTTAIHIQPLLQKLQETPKPPLLASNGSSPVINAYANLHQELNKTITELEAQKQKGFFSFLFKQSNANLVQWQNFCRQQQQKLIEQQVDALEAIAEQVTKWQDSALIAEQAKLTQDLRIQLNESVNSVERHIDHAVSETLKERFKEIAFSLKIAQPLSDSCQQHLFAIIHGNPPENGKLNILYRYHRYVHLAIQNKPHWYDALVTKAVNATIQRLKIRFHEHQANTANPEQAKAAAKKLFRDMLIIQTLSGENQKGQLKTYLYHYINTYLQQLLVDKVLPEALAAQEGLILVLTKPNSFLADTHIHQSLLQIRHLREAGFNKEMEQTIDALAAHTDKDYESFASIRQKVLSDEQIPTLFKVNC